MKSITCTLIKSKNIKCRLYDICKSPNKDTTPEKCPIRFDYEFQARRKFILAGETWEDIDARQKGQK